MNPLLNDYFKSYIFRLKEILKSKFWYIPGEFLILMKYNKPLFNQEKFQIYKKKQFNNIFAVKSPLTNMYLCAMERLENDIPYLVLKYIYYKIHPIFLDFKRYCLKNNLDLENTINHFKEQLEKFVLEKNVKYFISNSKEFYDKIVLFKEIFYKSKVKDASYMKLLKKSKMQNFFSNSFLINASIKKVNEGDNEGKIKGALESFVLNSLHLNFTSGKFDYLQKKSTIEVEGAKFLEGKLYTMYSLDNDIVNKGPSDQKGGTKLVDLLKKKNSFYFPNDNQNFKSKSIQKLWSEAKKNDIFNNELRKRTFKKFSNYYDMKVQEEEEERKRNMNNKVSKSINLFSNLEIKKKINDIKENIIKSKISTTKFIQISSEKLPELPVTRQSMSVRKHLSVKLVNKKEEEGLKTLSLLDSISSKKENSISIKDKPRIKHGKHFKFKKLIRRRKKANKNQAASNIIELLNKVKPQHSCKISYSKNVEYCYNEKIFQEISKVNTSPPPIIIKKNPVVIKKLKFNENTVPVELKREVNKNVTLLNGIESYKKKLFGLDRDYKQNNLLEKKIKTDEADNVLKNIVFKRNFRDENHRNFLNIIKTSGV